MLDRFKELLGFGGSDEGEEHEGASFPDEEQREARPAASVQSQAVLVIVRGKMGQERKEELAELIRAGKMVVLDLRGMDKEPGQSLLDFLSGVAFACRGEVLRVAGGIFLAAPKKNMIDEWEEDNRG
ncbi:MAG TPA: cell division protein SepF [Synergistaceae bacterium]|nr:cell division protein SepF [Synergistaceae bacterium]